MSGLIQNISPRLLEFTVDGPKKSIDFGFNDPISGQPFIMAESIIIQIGVVIFLLILFAWLGHGLKEKPETKRQVAAEFIVKFFSDSVEQTMGSKYVKHFTPYIGGLFMFSMSCSLMGIFGLTSPNSDLFVVFTWGLLTFFMVFINKLRTGGPIGFVKSLFSPTPIMLPFNIIGDLAAPVSMTLRQFGNIMGGGVILGLLYYALSHVYLAVGIPAVLSLYFDFFGAVVQAYIFVMLTMCYVGQGDLTEE